MKLITQINVRSEVSRKTSELKDWVMRFDKCIIPTVEMERDFIRRIRQELRDLNEKYPKTAPLEIFGLNRYGVYISPVGNPQLCISQIQMMDVDWVMLDVDNVVNEKFVKWSK